MNRGLLLNVVIGQCAIVFELFACKDQALLIGRDPLLVLDLLLHRVDGIRGLYLECDGLSRERLWRDRKSVGSRATRDARNATYLYKDLHWGLRVA